MRSALIIATNFCLVFLTRAQQNDFVGLAGLSAAHNLTRSWEVSVAGQSLFYQNLSELWIASTDLGFGFRINSNLKTEVHYRPMRFRTLDNFYEARNLFYHTITYSEGKGGFSLSVRNRLQQLVYGDHFNDTFKGPRWYNRDRITLKYRLDYYWSVFLNHEIFLPLNHPSRKKIDQVRTSAGLVRTFNDRISVEAYFGLQQQLNRSANNRRYLGALNLYLSI